MALDFGFNFGAMPLFQVCQNETAQLLAFFLKRLAGPQLVPQFLEAQPSDPTLEQD